MVEKKRNIYTVSWKAWGKDSGQDSIKKNNKDKKNKNSNSSRGANTDTHVWKKTKKLRRKINAFELKELRKITKVTRLEKSLQNNKCSAKNRKITIKVVRTYDGNGREKRGKGDIRDENDSQEKEGLSKEECRKNRGIEESENWLGNK